MILGGDRQVNEMFSAVPEFQGNDVALAIDFVEFQMSRLKDSNVKVLVRFEGPTSSPLSHSQRFERKFDKVIDVGTTNRLPWPVDGANFAYIYKADRKQRAAMVVGNKISFSLGELYSLRRAVALDEKVDLRGVGWNVGLFSKIVTLSKALAVGVAAHNLKASGGRNWLKPLPGRVEAVTDKWSFASEYAVALVIENDATRLTEKLFDALASGCFVIYSGASLSGLPEQILHRVVECEPDLAKIRKALRVAIIQEWTPPSSDHVATLKRHYSGARDALIEQIKSEIRNAKLELGEW